MGGGGEERSNSLRFENCGWEGWVPIGAKTSQVAPRRGRAQSTAPCLPHDLSIERADGNTAEPIQRRSAETFQTQQPRQGRARRGGCSESVCRVRRTVCSPRTDARSGPHSRASPRSRWILVQRWCVERRDWKTCCRLNSLPGPVGGPCPPLWTRPCDENMSTCPGFRCFWDLVSCT